MPDWIVQRHGARSSDKWRVLYDGPDETKARAIYTRTAENLRQGTVKLNGPGANTSAQIEDQMVKKRRSKPRRVSVARDPKYLEFLRQEGWCSVCIGSPVEPAHGPVNGLSSKGSDLLAIPLCRKHHNEQHRIGWKGLEAKYWSPESTWGEMAAWWNQKYKKESPNDESSK